MGNVRRLIAPIAVTLAAPAPASLQRGRTDGACGITIGLASADQISGAFTCTDLSGGSNAVVDVTGSFNAQG